MMQDEKMAMAAVSEPGMLHGAGGHKAAGSIHILTKAGRHKVHFTSDFKAESAADVHVVLSTEARPVSGSVTLAQLDRLAGEQLIDVPANVDPSRYSHLLLWSKKTRALLAVAKDEMQDGSMSKSP